jgi:hypothetical protein
MRAREIDRWAQSAQFKGLLTKNRANMVQQVRGGAAGGREGAGVLRDWPSCRT